MLSNGTQTLKGINDLAANVLRHFEGFPGSNAPRKTNMSPRKGLFQ